MTRDELVAEFDAWCAARSYTLVPTQRKAAAAFLGEVHTGRYSGKTFVLELLERFLAEKRDTTPTA